MKKLFELAENFQIKYASETVHYKGFIIKIKFDDGDWEATISKPGDKEGYMPEFGMNKENAIGSAKTKIDKIIDAINRGE